MAVAESARSRRPSAPVSAAPAAAPGQGIVSVVSAQKRFNARESAAESGKGSEKSFLVVDNVSFEVRRGELVTLLGPSGCGKTTLLRMVAGLLTVDSGTISIEGEKVNGPRRNCCMVFQNFGLLPWRTVMGNVEFALELDGVARKSRREVAAHYIELVGLQRFADHFPHELSGGMQQRVGIARALTRHPSVLLMDEPFGALDAQTREQLQDDFLEVWQRVGITVLFVTHSIDEALVLSDKVLVFSARPARIKCILESPLGTGERGNALRGNPEFTRRGLEIREMLKTEARSHG